MALISAIVNGLLSKTIKKRILNLMVPLAIWGSNISIKSWPGIGIVDI